MQEIFDGEPIAFYRGKFNGVRFVLDPDWAAGEAQMGKLPIVMVACRIGKPVYDDDKDGDRFKEVTFRVEEVVPLTGELRKQAMIYMAHMGEEGVIDFPTNPDSQKLQQALRQQERLEQFLVAEFGDQAKGEGETPVEMAIRLLAGNKAQRASTVPHDVTTTDYSDIEVLPQAEEDVDWDELAERVQDAKEQAMETGEPVVMAAQVKSVVPPIPPEEEMGRRSTLKTGHFDPTDDDGFATHHNSSDPEVEVVGSVYGGTHSGATGRLLEDVFE
jgi:hypothetical protein